MTRLYFILGLFLCCLIACQEENMGPTDVMEDVMEEEEEEMKESVPHIIPDGSENYLNLKSDYIFDQDSLHTFELIIPEDNLDLINTNPTAEEYVEGQLVFNGDTISPIGVRYKGSIGAFVGCTSGNDWANPSGVKTCTKLSMKLKINWEEREEKFYKLKKLQFHSMNNDPSQMHDRLGYHLFREMGVPAPRAVHARLVINGEYNGLFSLVEQIDGRFTDFNFEEEDGNLYKEVWPLRSNGNPFPDQVYLNALKTNEDENPNIDLMKTFAFAMATAESKEEQKEIVEQYLDLSESLAYAVVDRTIRHDDGPFHWYCGDSGDCASHNFYWYEEPIKEKLHLIAWDLDNAFDNIIEDSNPVTPIADDWGQTRNNCSPFPDGWLFLEQLSAACDKITGTLATYDEEYEKLQEEFINGPFSEDEVNTLLDLWAEQIRAATIEASETNSDALSISEWENNLNRLKEQCEHARE